MWPDWQRTKEHSDSVYLWFESELILVKRTERSVGVSSLWRVAPMKRGSVVRPAAERPKTRGVNKALQEFGYGQDSIADF